MVEGDIFREVDEELKREQYSKLWDKYGYLVVGAAVGIIVSVAGYKYWIYQQEQQAATYGEQYMEALNLASGGDKKKAAETLDKITSSGPRGYAMLSQIREAAAKAAEGKPEEAVIQYDRLSGNKSVDTVFQDFSRIQAAMLRVDKADEVEMKQRLATLADGKSSWRHSARELLGLSAFKAANYKGAEAYYNQIVSDRAAPQGLRQRAEMMMSLIAEETAELPKGQSDTPKTEEKPKDTKAKEAGKVQ